MDGLVLGAAPGLVLHLLELEATVHRLEVTCGDGVRRNVVLNHGCVADYLDATYYLSATIGRYARSDMPRRHPVTAYLVVPMAPRRDHERNIAGRRMALPHDSACPRSRGQRLGFRSC